MFAHQFKYTLSTLFKNKSLIFWTFAFPIILCLLFQLAFSDIEKNEKLDIFNIAIINNEEFNDNEIYKDTFYTLGDQANDDRLFSIKYVDINQAKTLLDNDDIKGYFILENDKGKIVTKTSGVYETVLKYVVDEINETSKMTSKLTEMEIKKGIVDYEKISQNVRELLETEETYTHDISQSHMSYMLVEFYTLIAMTCLYGGVVVMEAMNQTLPNMSSIGKRVSISPMKKSKLILSSILASLVIELIGVTILLLFCNFILHIDFGDHLIYIIPLSFVGTLAGLSLGLFVSIIIKAHENTKVGIIIAISMALSILSGMTGVVLKYVIDKNMPIINKLNPASMITDGFYSLYYYDTLDRYITDVVSLLIFALFFIGISCFILRRQKYDNI